MYSIRMFIFLSINIFRAEKWMGRIYESVGDILKAVIHYERYLEL